MLVLVVEIIGLTAVVPYGMLLPFHTLSSGSKGLPVDDGRAILPPEKRFRVHILVPCYKVSFPARVLIRGLSCKGLPVDDGRAILPPERFRVHILVPCYKVRVSDNLHFLVIVQGGQLKVVLWFGPLESTHGMSSCAPYHKTLDGWAVML